MAAKGSWLSTGIVTSSVCWRQDIGNCLTILKDSPLCLSNPFLLFPHSPSLCLFFLCHPGKQLQSHFPDLFFFFDRFICKSATVQKQTPYLCCVWIYEASVWILSKSQNVWFDLVILEFNIGFVYFWTLFRNQTSCGSLVRATSELYKQPLSTVYASIKVVDESSRGKSVHSVFSPDICLILRTSSNLCFTFFPPSHSCGLVSFKQTNEENKEWRGKLGSGG